MAEFCTPRGLEVNVKKTKVMVFERRKSSSPAFNYRQQSVEQVDSFRYLGIMFHSTRGLNCAVEQLAAAANKAMFAMLGRCQQMHIQQPELKLKLFDALVRPVLSYACEVWAPIASRSALETLEQVQKQFLRKLLGVPKQTCLKMLYAEFGRLPLQHFWWHQCAKYLQRLQAMESSRLCKQAFMAECRSGSGWWKAVVTKCTKLEVPPPHPESEFDATSATNADHNAAVTAIMTADTGKLMQATYFSFKTDFQMESYISQAKNKQLRRILASFRVGCHWLRVHTGRYEATTREQRICSHEHCTVVEDEVHAIFFCPAHASLRQKYADLFDHIQGHDLKAFLTQPAVHRLASFLTECRALATK